MRSLLDQQNFNARKRGSFRRLQTCDTATNDHDIREEIEMLVRIRIAILRAGRFAKARGLANKRFIHMLPKRARIHEHFVVKSSR